MKQASVYESKFVNEEIEKTTAKHLAKLQTKYKDVPKKLTPELIQLQAYSKSLGIDTHMPNSQPDKCKAVQKAIEIVHDAGFDLSGLKIRSSKLGTRMFTGDSVGVTQSYEKTIYLNKNTNLKHYKD